MVIEADSYAPEGLTPLHQFLGVRFLRRTADDEPGALGVLIDVRDDLKGPAGTLEGGVVATLVDIAGAACAARAMAALPATQSMSLSFLSPVRVGPARATARPLRVGSRDAVVEVKVTDDGNDGRLCATALLTAVALRKAP